MSVIQTWNYRGSDIHSRADEKINMTEMWKAAGGDQNKRPGYWLSLPSTVEFSAHLTEGGFSTFGEIAETSKGGNFRGGATWAHWHLALAYARYLDHAFHIWCNNEIRLAMTREVRPALVTLDATIANSARVSDDPFAVGKLRLACQRVANAKGCTIHRVYGYVRKTQHLSSPFALSLALLDHELRVLEGLEIGPIALLSPKDRRLLAAARKWDGQTTINFGSN